MAPPKSKYNHFPEEVDKFPQDVNPTEAWSLESLVSDVDDPVWPSVSLDYGPDRTQTPEGTAVEDDPVIRTVSGLLDLLHHVRDEVDEWIERESDGEGHKWPRRADKPMVIQTSDRGSQSFRANTFNIGVATGGVRVAQQRMRRKSVVVTNYGPGVAFFSHQSVPWGYTVVPTGSGIPTNVASIAVNATREIPTEAEVWMYPAVSGTAQVVDVIEYYGTPDDQPYS